MDKSSLSQTNMEVIMNNLCSFSRVLIIVSFVLMISACTFIKEGTSEQGYFIPIADVKNDWVKIEGKGYRFQKKVFYQKHRQTMISSDASYTMATNFVESGDPTKPAILFVHGSPGDWSAFWQYMVVTELKEKAHLISVDRPGWGDSKCETKQGERCFLPLLKEQSKYYAQLLKKLDEQNNHQGIILVGWSLGGPMIGQLALDYPEYIKGLIFIASPFDPQLSQPKWYNWLSQSLAWFVPKRLENSNDEMMPLAKQLTEMKPQWASIDVPIWVIQGSIDDLVNRDNFDYARKFFASKHAKFIEVETSGHFVMYERMSVVIDSIRTALEKLPRPTSASLQSPKGK